MKSLKLIFPVLAISLFSLIGCGSKVSHHLEFVAEVPATCTEDGLKSHYICTDPGCENKFFNESGTEIRGSTLVIESKGHIYDNDPQLRYRVSEADCEHAAVYNKACTGCGKKGTETFQYGSPLGHKYSKPEIKATVGGETHNHKGVDYQIEYTATMTCSECHKSVIETKLGTFAVAPGEDSTCTKDGKATVTVAFSEKFGGDFVKEETLVKTGHKIEGVDYSFDSTNHWKECEYCQEHLEVTAHTKEQHFDENEHWCTCAVCEKEYTRGAHSYSTPTFKVMNIDTGLVRSTKACTCGKEIYEEKTGTVNVIDQPGCTAKGSASVTVTFSEAFGGAYSGTCDIAPKGHKSDEITHSDEDKGHYNVCTVCSEHFNYQDHVNTSWKIETYPTDTEPGSKSSDCDTCGHKCLAPFYQCESGKHVGTHYTGYAPTKLTSGISEYYYCDTCHKVILSDEHKAGDGTWTEGGLSPAVDRDHKAYLGPTITLEETNAALADIGGIVDINRLPISCDSAKVDLTEGYVNAYLLKPGAKESDLVGLDNIAGARKTISYINYDKIAESSAVIEPAHRTVCYGSAYTQAEYSQEDVENQINYTRLTCTGTGPEYYSIGFLYGGIFDGVTKDCQVLVRTNFDTSIHIYGMSKRSVNQTNLTANKWTPVTITYNIIQLIQEEMAEPDPEYNTFYFSNNDKFASGQIFDIGPISEINMPYDLSEYKCYSNEGYSTLYTAGGLSGYVGTYLHNNPWFSGAREPEYHPDYRNYFFETYVSNKSGTNKTYSDLLVNNSYYGGIYFGLSGNITYNDTPKELFLMVYSNEQVNIKYSNFGDIVRKGSEGHVLKEDVIYKGWNYLHLDIDPDNPASYNFTGHCLQIVPEVWSTSLIVTTACMFSKSAL